MVLGLSAVLALGIVTSLSDGGEDPSAEVALNSSDGLDGWEGKAERTPVKDPERAENSVLLTSEAAELRESIGSCLSLDPEDVPTFLVRGGNDWKLARLDEMEGCDESAAYEAWKERYEELNSKILEKYKELSESGELKKRMQELFDGVKERHDNDDAFVLLEDSGLVLDGVTPQQFVFVSGEGEYNVQLYPTIALNDVALDGDYDFIWKAQITCVGAKCRVGDVTNIVADDIDRLAEEVAAYLYTI